MVVDTSAVLAILRHEPEAAKFAAAIETAATCLISAVSVLEAGIVSHARHGEAGVLEFDAFLAAAGLEVVAFGPDEAAIARVAWARYGKGRHPAALNFGDCAVYATAMGRGLPLLYKGTDFAATDLPSA